MSTTTKYTRAGEIRIKLTWPLDRALMEEVKEREQTPARVSIKEGRIVGGRNDVLGFASRRGVVRDAVTLLLSTRSAQGSLGEQLRKAREEAGLKLVQLEAESGVAPGVVSRIETTNNDPRVNTLRKLAGALGVSIVIDPHGVAVVPRSRR